MHRHCLAFHNQLISSRKPINRKRSAKLSPIFQAWREQVCSKTGNVFFFRSRCEGDVTQRLAVDKHVYCWPNCWSSRKKRKPGLFMAAELSLYLFHRINPSRYPSATFLHRCHRRFLTSHLGNLTPSPDDADCWPQGNFKQYQWNTNGEKGFVNVSLIILSIQCVRHFDPF